MIIRKTFIVNNSHIVRNCYSDRCKYSLHAHTGVLEVFFEGTKVDRAGMLLDFGITKQIFKPFITVHDNAVLIWKKDSNEYKNFIKSKTDNWIELDFTPSAELLAAYFYLHFSSLLSRVVLANNEDPNLELIKVRYHETRTGWAEVNGTDVLDIIQNQKIVLTVANWGPVPRKKLDEIEKIFKIYGEYPIKIDAPKIQVH